MNDASTPVRPPVWTRLSVTLDRASTRAALATLRRGVGKQPGTVPGLWPYYTALDAQGRVTRALRAEHTAMTLFSIHQQSHATPMHRAGGRSFGEALRQYRAEDSNATPDRDPEDTAVDKRMAAIASATSYRELEEHLRRAFSLLRKGSITMDYDSLYRDLREWQNPASRTRVVRRWGSGYFVPRPKSENSTIHQPSQKGESNA